MSKKPTALEAFNDGQKSVLDQRNEARDEADRLREALAFYANPEYYTDATFGTAGQPTIAFDGGAKARAALSPTNHPHTAGKE
jgi:hypothetical protein